MKSTRWLLSKDGLSRDSLVLFALTGWALAREGLLGAEQNGLGILRVFK